jgi:hypothetical protein
MKKDLFHWDIETVGQYKDFTEFELNDKRGSDLFRKKFTNLGWDVKYVSLESAYLEQSGIVSTFGKICCISFGYLDKDVERISSFYGDDEKEIVSKFNNLLKKIELKDFSLCGFRILYFDIPWLLHKLHKYKITPADIIYLYDKKPWENRIVDMSDDWKQKFAWGFSFDSMLYELGIDSPKDDMDGSKVHSSYWNGNILDIKDYCEKDVLGSIRASEVIY